MRQTHRSCLVAFGLVLAGASVCGNAADRHDGVEMTAGTTAPAVLATPAPGQVRSYFDDALAIIETEALNRDRVDWRGLRATLDPQVAAARTPEETWPAIKQALRALDDRHSMFLPPQVAKLSANAPAPRFGVTRRGGVVIVRVPAYLGTDLVVANGFARQAALRLRSNARGACGVVLDLRSNVGGNMWPMFGAVSPLLTRGVVGHFESIEGERAAWRVSDGDVRVGDIVMIEGLGSSRRVDLPVAVLYGPDTLSSGEAVALAFRGQPETRSFGTQTGGSSTANRLFELRDGARIALTTQWMSDREGRRAQGALSPDEPISTPGAEFDAAIGWLGAEHGCDMSWFRGLYH